MEAAERVSASRKLGRDKAEELLASAEALIVAKGRKLSRFDVSGAIPDGAVDAMLGSTGNLRAPTLVVGTTLLVGFNQDVYEDILG